MFQLPVADFYNNFNHLSWQFCIKFGGNRRKELHFKFLLNFVAYYLKSEMFSAIREINRGFFLKTTATIWHIEISKWAMVMPLTFGKTARKSFVVKLLKLSPCSGNLGKLRFYSNKMFNKALWPS